VQTTATITSKRQLTIPIAIFKKLGLKENQKVLIRENKGILEIESAMAAVERLAGSVKIPKRLQGVDLDQVIEEAIDIHIAEKYGKKKE